MRRQESGSALPKEKCWVDAVLLVMCISFIYRNGFVKFSGVIMLKLTILFQEIIIFDKGVPDLFGLKADMY